MYSDFFSLPDPGPFDFSDPFMMFILIYYGAIILASLAFSITVYIFEAIGLHTIAKRRGIHHAWLAWVPVGNAWILGSISDQYQYVVKGKIRNRRKVLLWLMLGFFVITIGVLALTTSTVITSFEVQDGFAAFYGMIPMMGGVYILDALLVVVMVFSNIAYFDLYRSCNPGTSIPFLILSIVLSLAPFFVFANRKKDLGMPPRRVRTAPVIDV